MKNHLDQVVFDQMVFDWFQEAFDAATIAKVHCLTGYILVLLNTD